MVNKLIMIMQLKLIQVILENIFTYSWKHILENIVLELKFALKTKKCKRMKW